MNQILGDNRESGPAMGLEKRRTGSLQGPDFWPVGIAKLVSAHSAP